MKAKTIRGNSPEEIKNELSESISDGFKPTLAIIFISIKQDREAVCDIINNKGIDIIGATSSGEFIDGHESEGGIVILLLDLNRNYYSILFEDIQERSLEEATQSMIECALKKFEKPAFILVTTLLKSDGGMLDGEGMVRYIEKLAGPDISMFGGMAGDDLSFKGTWIFTQGKSTDYGMAALVLDESKIELHGLAFSGWKPMGVPRTVTKSEGNLIYSIDNRPALEIYLHLLGEEISSSDDQIDFFDRIGVHYPFQIERENREPKMCNPIGYDKRETSINMRIRCPSRFIIEILNPSRF